MSWVRHVSLDNDQEARHIVVHKAPSADSRLAASWEVYLCWAGFEYEPAFFIRKDGRLARRFELPEFESHAIVAKVFADADLDGLK